MSKLTEVLKRENWYLKIRYILTIKKQKYEMIAGWVVVNAILYPERYQKLIIRPQNGKKLPIQAFYEVLDNVGVRRLWYPVAQNDLNMYDYKITNDGKLMTIKIFERETGKLISTVKFSNEGDYVYAVTPVALDVRAVYTLMKARFLEVSYDEVERWRLGYEDCQTLLWSEYHQRIYSYEYADDDYKPMLGSTFKC